jgi:DtxR family Mn-dependent transcriptional regulator
MTDERAFVRPEEIREECLEALFRLERTTSTITVEQLRENPDLQGIDIPEALLDLIARGDIRLRDGKISIERSGRMTGRRIYRRHELAERFLRVFGLKRERAHREACRLEHVMSLPDERRHHVATRDELSRLFELSEQGAVPLARGVRGVPYRVALVCGGHGARRKLEDMGVSRGAQVELCGRQGRGPVEISVRGSRLALGHGIASKVLVVPPAAAFAGPGKPAGMAAFRRGRRGLAGRHVHHGFHHRHERW